MLSVLFLSVLFTLIIIAVLLIVDFFSYKQEDAKLNFGIKFMILKVFFNRKSGILYTSVLCFSFFTLLLNWGLMKMLVFNYYYSFWIIVVITLVSFLVLQNYLILISTKVWNCTRKVSFFSEKNFDMYIDIFDKDTKRSLEKINLSELITYLKIFYEGMSLLLALFVIGLSINSYIDKSYVQATNFAYSLCIFIPLISLKLHEQRYKFLKDKNE